MTIDEPCQRSAGGNHRQRVGGRYQDSHAEIGADESACRLVADTGIHWKGWSLEEARACFRDNSALAPHNIETELQRYIGWPGQALAYKIGELKLRELRKKAETQLGARFDVREFHDTVLLGGPLPLDMLEQRVDAWIAQQMLEVLRHGDKPPDHYRCPQAVWQFGKDLTLVALSGEVVVDYVPLLALD